MTAVLEDARAEPARGDPGEKGLRGGTLGFLSGVVIGVSSTAPGYSLAASLGIVSASAGLFAPGILLVAFLPMLLIAGSFYYLNRADPDCGTSFSWGTKALGPWIGWMTGWGILAADIIVMPSLADVASSYSFQLFGSHDPSTFWRVFIGCAFIAILTFVCYVGIEASARLQYALLLAEIIALVAFSVTGFYRLATKAHIAGSTTPSIGWLNPFGNVSSSAFVAAFLAALFIYWGWDSTVNVNEESSDSAEGPGKAAIVSTFVLVGIYLVVSFAAQAYHGPKFLVDNSDDVLGALATDVMGGTWSKVLILAVLTSAAASTQTTILPTTRTSLSMAIKGAIPGYFARVHPRFLTPSASTIWFGMISILVYVGFVLISENVLSDAVASLGLYIAFYYGLTGIACAVFYRRELTRSVKDLILVGIAPTIGGVILLVAMVKSIFDLSDTSESTTGSSVLGLSVPLFVAIAVFVLGLVLMLAQYANDRTFFERRPEIARPGTLARIEAHEEVPPPADSVV
jgi:amino acid transporter